MELITSGLFCLFLGASFHGEGARAEESSVSSDLQKIFDSLPGLYDRDVSDGQVQDGGRDLLRFYGFATALGVEHLSCDEAEPGSARCQADVSIQHIRGLTPGGEEVYFETIPARIKMVRVPQVLGNFDQPFPLASVERVVLRSFRFREESWNGDETTAADTQKVLSAGRRRLETILNSLQGRITEFFSGKSVTELYIENRE